MSIHTPEGAVYTTKDLIRMAQLEYFGQYSPVVCRALSKLAFLEDENKKLKEKILSMERKNTEPSGTVVKNLL